MPATLSGPFFDGTLERRLEKAIADGVVEAGEEARRNVQRADVQRTGYTSSKVTVRRVGATGFRVTGGGLAWRPWLEGTAPRNRISSYKGGRPFQRAHAPTETSTERILNAAIAKAIR